MIIKIKPDVTSFNIQVVQDGSKSVAEPTHLEQKFHGALITHLARHVQRRVALEGLCKAVHFNTNKGGFLFLFNVQNRAKNKRRETLD